MSEPEHEFLRRVNGDRQEVPEAGTRKPDPSEPWRYVCPDCGGQVQGSGRVYECKRESCRTTWEKFELHDKKRDGEIHG